MADKTQSERRSPRSKVLIVDDEQVLCAFLAEAIGEMHEVKTCFSGLEALDLVRDNEFDLIVTDLRLPDISGIDILKYAKEKDEFVEVIIITGYASLDSAAKATNLGASSYLIKPLSLDELLPQIERATMSRAFHLKSIRLIKQTEQTAPDVGEHLYDVTTLYHFSRKMMLSLELPEIFQVILDDTNERMDAEMSVIGINLLEFSEVFAMPHHGSIDQRDVRKLLLDTWSPSFDFLDRRAFEREETPLAVIEGRRGPALPLDGARAYTIPMVVRGKTIGTLVLYSRQDLNVTPDTYQFLHVYTSLISSIVEHAYIDMQAQLLAKTDSLTGIANYRLFSESLAREIARADRRRTGFSLVLMDIDDFKVVNDTHGHLTGDQVLKDLARRISAAVRKGDLLARYGGEEFALILPDTTADGARILAERMRTAVSGRPLSLKDREVRYTISLGVAYYDGESPRDKDELIGDADRALYASKHNGKNCVTVC